MNYFTRISRISQIVFCGLLLGACTTSRVPIASSESAPFDSTVVGMWQVTQADSSAASPVNWVVVREFRRPEFVVLIADDNTDSPNALEKVIPMRGYISAIRGVSIMNVAPAGADTGFTFYRYSVARDTMVLRPLAENALGFKSSKQLRAYVTANIEVDSLYDGALHFVRVKDGGKNNSPF